MSATLTVVFQTAYVSEVTFGNGYTVKRTDPSTHSFQYSYDLGFNFAVVSSGWSGTFYWDSHSDGSDRNQIGTAANGVVTIAYSWKVAYTGANRTIYISAESSAPPTPDTYTFFNVRADANGGIFADGSAYTYYPAQDESITVTNSTTAMFNVTLLPTPSRQGYIFTGWRSADTGKIYTGNAPVSATSTDADDPTINHFTAQWKRGIDQFYWDGGSGSGDSSIIAAGLPLSNLTAARWNRLMGTLAELAEGNGGSFVYSPVATGSGITAAGFNVVRAAIASQPGHGATPGQRSAGDSILASYYNGVGSLKNALNSAIIYYNNR
nr:MAG: hypothetical protein [Bacteriophage sp.]